MGKIVRITEKTPRETILPDGNYQGNWGGNIITVNYKGKTYELETDEGVRGIGFNVTVIIKGKEQTFIEINN